MTDESTAAEPLNPPGAGAVNVHPEVDPMKAREVTASIILIERRADVPVPAGVLATLVAFALAGPSNDASRQIRDEAVAKASAAYLTEFERLRAEGSL